MHLPFGSRGSSGPSPRWDLALVKLIDFGGGAAGAGQIVIPRKRHWRRKLINLPLRLRKIQPEEDTDRHRKGGVDKTCLETESEKHRRSRIAAEIS